MRRRWMGCLVLLAWGAGATTTNGQQPDDWIGRRVITRFGTALTDGGRVVDNERSPDSPPGESWRLLRVYRVERVDGSALRLEAETGGASGWVRATDVVPLEGAVGYYSDAIRSDTNAAAAYQCRGLLRCAEREYEEAVADFTAALQRAPTALAYYNRATARSLGGDTSGAIADYDEATRLAPGYVAAYHGRGIAHTAVGAVERALADYGEALRLDPTDFRSLGNRAWLQATHPESKYRDGKAAVLAATRCCELWGWGDAAG